MRIGREIIVHKLPETPKPIRVKWNEVLESLKNVGDYYTEPFYNLEHLARRESYLKQVVLDHYVNGWMFEVKINHNRRAVMIVRIEPKQKQIDEAKEV